MAVLNTTPSNGEISRPLDTHKTLMQSSSSTSDVRVKRAEDTTGTAPNLSSHGPSSTDTPTLSTATPSLAPAPFGRAMRAAHFRLAEGHLAVNHGSYGLSPVYVQRALEAQSAIADSRPDRWIRWDMPAAARRSRAAVAKLLHVADVSSVVLVPNTTTATATVLHNLAWEVGDVVLYYTGCYAALEKAVHWAAERGPVVGEEVDVVWPIADDVLVERIEAAIVRIHATPGRRVRVLLLDTVLSQPGVRVPWERLCAVARTHGVLSVVDGAHGVGQIPIDLEAARPDFFASNLHKWLHVPRGCAVFYAAPDVQHLLRATMPISHGFLPKAMPGARAFYDPLPKERSRGAFIDSFEWVATIDYLPYTVVEDALQWRKEACGGEEAIMKYCVEVAQRGADAAAKILGTYVMDAEVGVPEKTTESRTGAETEDTTSTSSRSKPARYLTRSCALSNVLLPIAVHGHASPPGAPSPIPSSWAVVNASDAPRIMAYIQMASARLVDSYFHNVRQGDAWWWRLSGQVYVEVADFEEAAERMQSLVDRVRNGTWISEMEGWLDEEYGT